MDTNNMRKRCKSILMAAGWLVALHVYPLSVWADCTTSDNQQFNVLVDATSSCAALSPNMYGCMTDANGKCVIRYFDRTTGIADGREIEVQVSPSNAVGSIPVAPGLVSWTATSNPLAAGLGGKLVDFAILVGANGGGTCGWSYTPGEDSDIGLAFLKTNNTYQKVSGISFCSDFTAPPPALSRLVLSKTVMLEGGTCGQDDVEVLQVGAGTKVEYCFVVENVGIGRATGVYLNDPDANIVDQFIGIIEGGAPPQTIQSSPITISKTGEIINTATVTGTNDEDPAQSESTGTDSATVVSQLKVEACPPDYQKAVDDFYSTEDGFKYAALLDPLNPERVSVCVPSNVQLNEECNDQCVLKTDPNNELYDCKANPTSVYCSPPYSKCEQSGAWGTGDSCPTPAPAGTLPYCWEVAQDPDGNCQYKAIEPLVTHSVDVQEYHDNPFCYQSCTTSGKTKTCNYICF